ncbi:MAG TPA: hypothetical protein VMQ65_10070 [Candidatus Limnocylindria bacterium]|nr:hypothetical protein [Candidatus Limnocylindria bacterium]
MIGNGRRWLQAFGALCGILGPILSFGGFMLIGSTGFAVQAGASLDEIARVVARQAPPLTLAGLTLGVLGSLAFVVFAGRLWGTLREAEGAPAWLSTTAFGAALLAVAGGFVDKTMFAAIFTQAGAGLEPSVAAALYAAASAAFGLFSAFSGLFIGLAAVVILQTGVLPRWLGWLGVAVLVLAVFGVAVAEIGFLAFPLVLIWMIAASLLLLRRPLPV